MKCINKKVPNNQGDFRNTLCLRLFLFINTFLTTLQTFYKPPVFDFTFSFYVLIFLYFIFYPLTEPSKIPPTIYFCNNTNIITTGRTSKTE